MAKRENALDPVYHPGSYGLAIESAAIEFELVREFDLQQVAVWPSSFRDVAKQLGFERSVDRSIGASSSAVLHVEPLKFWILGRDQLAFQPQLASTLDLSHSRTRLIVSGSKASELLNRFLPIDLREQQFPTYSLASTGMHHVSITVWHSDRGYELFIPRSYSQSIFELLYQSALQFGLRVK